MLFKKPKVFTYYWTQLGSSCQVYTAALTSFHSSSFFRTLPATACVSLICLPPKHRDPAFLDGWSSATFSTAPGINALVEAEDIEVSLLGMFVDSENFRGSSEGGLGGLGLAVQSGHPHSQSLWVLEFLYMQPKALWKPNQKCPLHVSGSPPSRHMEELHFLAHWGWVGPYDQLWPMSCEQEVSLLSLCHHRWQYSK